MISVEQFAELRAALESGELADVVARAGLDAEEWARTNDHYRAAFEAEMRAGERDLAARFLDAYRGTLGDRTLGPGIASPGALPFQSVSVAAPLAGPSGEALAVSSFDETLPADAALSATLPFLASPPVAPPEAPLADPSGETLAAIAGPQPRSMPFHGLMDLDRYAQMAAELRAKPERAEAIMMRFGLFTAEQRSHTHQEWRRRFEADAELHQRFTSAVEKHARTK